MWPVSPCVLTCLPVPSLLPTKPAHLTGQTPKREELTLISSLHLLHLPTERRGEEDERLGGSIHKPSFPRGGTWLESVAAPRKNLAALTILLGC